MELIFSDVTWGEVKRQIFFRKTKTVLLFIFHLVLWKPLAFIGRLISKIFNVVYTKYYPRRESFKKQVKLLIFLYYLFVVGFNVGMHFGQGRIYIWTIIAAVLIIPVYFGLKFLLFLYHMFIGDYQLKEEALFYTKLYITSFMMKLLKIFGKTGSGKDTLMSGLATTLSEEFNTRTIQDMEEIRDICYIIDFKTLDEDLLKNYKFFLSFSKVKTYDNFIGSEEEPGIARFRQLYIKSYFLKTKQLTPEKLLSDYERFMDDPIHHPTNYATGTGVGRRHFLQLIMEEYIQWFIRINIEKNFIISNQPFLENVEEGIMAREFNFNFLKTKKIVSKKSIKDPKTGNRKKLTEKVFFPWKDRLILTETECGTWWSNKDNETGSELTEGGIRDFKAYQRHFMKDFYWFQVDQASDRTQKLFRELDHGYAYILSRTEIEGGKKKNLFLNYMLGHYQRRIDKMNRRVDKANYLRDRKYQKFEDLQKLYVASSNPKYKEKLDKLEKKCTPRPLKAKYYEFQKKVSILKNQIKRNKKDGYIVLEVCMSPGGAQPSEYHPTDFKDLLKNPESIPATFVGRFVFRTKDCERYDTRYLRELAESKAQESEIVLAQVRRWPRNFKMSKDDVLWMGYSAGNDMYGITEEEQNNMKYFDGYKKYIDDL